MKKHWQINYNLIIYVYAYKIDLIKVELNNKKIWNVHVYRNLECLDNKKYYGLR